MRETITTLLLMFALTHSNAQIIYTNINPDAKFSCSKAGCSHQYHLDLNNDGIIDFSIIVTGNASFCAGNYDFSVSMVPSDSNGLVVTNPLSLTAVINDQSIYSSFSTTLESVYWYGNPRGGCFGGRTGAWSSSVDGYVGLKLKKGGETYYGWVRLAVSVSSKSASFTVKDFAYNNIANELILAGQSTNFNVVATSAITGSPFCAGSKVSVPYEVQGTFNASNIFTAQLSDPTGNFASPVKIGSRQSTVTGTISAKIPLSTGTASQYRIRVISSSPTSSSYDNGVDIIINNGLNAVISASGPTEFCSGAGVVMLSTPLINGYTFQWFNNEIPVTNETGNQTYAYSTGNYQCVVSNGCSNDTSNTIVVTAYPLPNAIITPSGPTVFCNGGSVTLYANTENGLTYQWIDASNGDTVSRNSYYVADVTASHYYEVRETNAKGCVGYSGLIFVEVNSSKEPDPKICMSDTTSCTGDSVLLYACNLSYSADQFQWRRNGVDIPGATSSFYFAKTAGTYKCKVTNACGSTITPGIIITVGGCYTANKANSSNTINANKQNNLDSTIIYPSAIIQIKKADPNGMRNSLQLPDRDDNELSEEHRSTSRETGTNFLSSQNNSLGNSISSEQKKSKVCPPLVRTNFEGNPRSVYYLLPLGYGPSECDIAISNAGKIVSISNTWMYYFNENGTLIFSDSLYHFGNSILDCHVLYDPKADRFVFSSSYGYYNADPFILNGYGTLIGFSKSNDPMDGWYLYQLPYTDFHDNSVGDYPLLAMSDSEVFITIDYYNSGDRYKHVEIMQIDKGEGYAGSASLISQKYDATLTGNTKGTMVPAQGGSTTYGPKMYFIMANESGNSSNKYYVYEITNTIASGQAVLKRYGPVTSNISYSAQGTSYQPGGIPIMNVFAADDVYMEDAFFENGVLQFCQHTNVNGKAAVCLGRITGIPNNLSCTAKTISDPNLYLSYPSIAYAGNSSADNSAIIGIEHSGANTYPGLSAAFVNSDFEVSSLVTVKTGNDTINGLWGDYSGICRRYNHPGEVWFEGQRGSATTNKINWIAKLKSQKCSSVQAADIVEAKSITPSKNSISIFPNPFSNSTTISFSLPQSQKVSISIYDLNGRLMKTLADAQMQAGTHQLTWDANNEKGTAVAAGIYFLKMQTETFSKTQKLIVIK